MIPSTPPLTTTVIPATMAAGMGATMIPTTTATPVATMVGITALAMEAGMTATTVAITLATTTAMPQGLLRVPTTSTTTTTPIHTGLALETTDLGDIQPTLTYVTKATLARLVPLIRGAYRRAKQSIVIILAHMSLAVPHNSVVTTTILSAAMIRAPHARRTTPTTLVEANSRYPSVVDKMYHKIDLLYLY